MIWQSGTDLWWLRVEQRDDLRRIAKKVLWSVGVLAVTYMSGDAINSGSNSDSDGRNLGFIYFVFMKGQARSYRRKEPINHRRASGTRGYIS